VRPYDSASEALDDLVEPFDGEADEWDDVLRRAQAGAVRARPRRWPRAAAALVTIAAVVALALAWPFGAESPTLFERALAAVGDGPVVRVVLQTEWGGTLVDLGTGERTALRGERELWFDPGRGVREVLRFGGTVEHDVVRPVGELAAHERKTLLGLVEGYRRALRSGEARVVGEGTVDGIPVYWLRIHSELLPDVADGRLHEWAQEVAVSRATYAPVYFRETRDGEPGPDTGSRVLRMESFPAHAVDLAPRQDPLVGVAMSVGTVGDVALGDASRLLGRPALWPGPSVGGLRLARASELRLRSGYSRDTRTWAEEVRGLELFYGKLTEEGAPRGATVPDYGEPFVVVREVPRLHPAFRTGLRNYVPPPARVLLSAGGRNGLLRRDRLVVAIEGSSPELVLAAARALRPVEA
jgi:hypothetical protein